MIIHDRLNNDIVYIFFKIIYPHSFYYTANWVSSIENLWFEGSMAQ